MNQFPSTPVPSYPISLTPEWKTLVSDFESGKEQRRQIWTFPKRSIPLKFNALIEDDIDTLYAFHLQQKGRLEPFWYFWPKKRSDNTWQAHTNEYVGRGDGSTVIFELPSKETTSLTVYANGVTIPATLLSGGGDAGVDRIQFDATGNITSSSVANPSVITTATNHGLTTGNKVTIAGHSGSTPSINGSHTVTVISPTTFSIPVNVTVGGTGGTWTIDPPANGSMLTADFTGQIRYRMRLAADTMTRELFELYLFTTGLELVEARI